MNKFILAIDQGTTSSRSIIFSSEGSIEAVAQKEFPQHYPHDGWVEHDPEEIWESVILTLKDVFNKCQVKTMESCTGESLQDLFISSDTA